MTGTYEGENTGSSDMEFYECASVSSGDSNEEVGPSDLVISNARYRSVNGGGDMTDDRLSTLFNGVWVYDDSSTDTNRKWTSKSDPQYALRETLDSDMFEITGETLYNLFLEKNGNNVDALVCSSPYTYSLTSGDFDGSFQYGYGEYQIFFDASIGGTAAELNDSGTSATPTWSGYKMVWNEGTEGSGILITPTQYEEEGEIIEDTMYVGEYLPGSNSYGAGFARSTGIRTDNKLWIQYVAGNYNKWLIWEPSESGDYLYFSNTTATKDATISEVCAGPWEQEDYGSFRPPVLNPMGSPAGWVKTDELVEGLEIKGYTPEVGKVYAFDSTINGNMYPAEIPSGGGDSAGGSSSGVAHTDNITTPSDDNSKVILLVGSLTASYNDKKGLHLYKWDAANSDWRCKDFNQNNPLVLGSLDAMYGDGREGFIVFDEDNDLFTVFTATGGSTPWECTWVEEGGSYDDIICIAWSTK